VRYSSALQRATSSRLTPSDLFGGGVLVRHRDSNSLISLFRGHPVRSLSIPSGQLVVGDPWDFANRRPLNLRLRPGRYAVYEAANEMDAGEDGAGLLLQISTSRVVRWHMHARVGIDGARIAFGDAGMARRPNRNWVDRLSNGTDLGPHFASSRVPGDGGYPLRSGFDARGQLAALAVTALDVRRYSPWPPPGSRIPPLDLSSLDACLTWARAVGGEQAIIRPGRLGQETLAALRSIAGRAIPVDLRRYYATHTPWVGEGASLGTFVQAARSGVAGSTFPVAVESADSLSVMREDGTVDSTYQGSTMGTNRDLKAWVVLNSIAVHDLHRISPE